MAEKKYTRIVVEENNEHGFDSYRVPGIVTASNGETFAAIFAGVRAANRTVISPNTMLTPMLSQLMPKIGI